MNIAPANGKKSLPVGDVILTANNLTLSEYYWTLNKILMKLRRGDETNWIWGRSAYELRHLSHLVRLKLPEYNQEKAIGVVAVVDGYWSCVADCIMEKLVGDSDLARLCYGICWSALAIPNPYSVGLCLTCVVGHLHFPALYSAN